MIHRVLPRRHPTACRLAPCRASKTPNENRSVCRTHTIARYTAHDPTPHTTTHTHRSAKWCCRCSYTVGNCCWLVPCTFNRPNITDSHSAHHMAPAHSLPEGAPWHPCYILKTRCKIVTRRVLRAYAMQRATLELSGQVTDAARLANSNKATLRRSKDERGTSAQRCCCLHHNLVQRATCCVCCVSFHLPAVWGTVREVLYARLSACLFIAYVCNLAECSVGYPSASSLFHCVAQASSPAGNQATSQSAPRTGGLRGKIRVRVCTMGFFKRVFALRFYTLCLYTLCLYIFAILYTVLIYTVLIYICDSIHCAYIYILVLGGKQIFSDHVCAL